MPNIFYYILTLSILYSHQIIADDINSYIHTSSGKVLGYFGNKVINYDDIPYAKASSRRFEMESA